MFNNVPTQTQYYFEGFKKIDILSFMLSPVKLSRFEKVSEQIYLKTLGVTFSTNVFICFSSASIIYTILLAGSTRIHRKAQLKYLNGHYEMFKTFSLNENAKRSS